ncbi:MAG: T9SS type A sorting domain-containing protein [Bacteroidota bacterium]
MWTTSLYAYTRYSLFLIVLFSLTNYAKAQDCSQLTLQLEDQSDIDEFAEEYPGCTVLKRLIISEGQFGTITNLDSLYHLTKITNSLEIYSNDSLKSITGLRNISSIGASLRIFDNLSLESLAGLDSISVVPWNLDLARNGSLENFQGLGGIDSIGNSLAIGGHTNLLNLSGLNGIKAVPDHIRISENNKLETLAGLDSLTSIGDYLQITQNPALKDLQGLGKLSSIEGNVRIQENASLMTLEGLGPIQEMHYVIISENDSLQSLKGLDSLIHIEYSLAITENPLLPNLEGLEQLSQVGEQLTIAENDLLQEVNALTQLQGIGDLLTIASNPVLKHLDGLESLSGIGEDQFANDIQSLQIIDNASLEQILGMSSLTYLRADIDISYNPLLSFCDVPAICDYVKSEYQNWDDPWNDGIIRENSGACANIDSLFNACEGTIDSLDPDPDPNPNPGGIEPDSLTVFPNPFEKWLHVPRPNGMELTSIRLLDSTGRIIKSLRNDQVKFYLPNLQLGLYFLQVETREERLMFKVVKR